jgi:Tol biopolymer transport system component
MRTSLGTFDIWRRDLARETEEERLTAGRGSELTPVWVNGERAIVFAGDSPGSVPHLFRKDLATGVEEQILPPGSQQLVLDTLPDGRAVAYAERQTVGRGFRILQLPLTAGATPAPLLPPQFGGFAMSVSPDGRAMAFIASRIGRLNLYVAALPVTKEPELAASGVWSAPRWSPDGRQLYYFGDDRTMMVIPIGTAPSLTVGMAEKLFELQQPALLVEVSREGRFLLLVPKVRAAARPIIVRTAAVGPAQR